MTLFDLQLMWVYARTKAVKFWRWFTIADRV